MTTRGKRLNRYNRIDGFCRSKAVCHVRGVKTNDMIDEAARESNYGAHA